ncbi:MAG TPA: ATP-binding protein [Candidatus Acidoferrum sp.]|nr:ATP-binding protein [Candidatus Acidoferrum sp.]
MPYLIMKPGKRMQTVQRRAMESGLAQAFQTFTQAAGSLEKSYTLLQSEVERLRGELEKANADLDRSLEENARWRDYLSQVLENLPCGVVVIGGAARAVQVMNPQARRLLQIPPEWNENGGRPEPELLERLKGEGAKEEAPCEQEWVRNGKTGNRYIGISRANLNGKQAGSALGDRIWIVRDVTEEKRLATEREAARESVALAEIATLLAHEIRNPLGSMELFTGLLTEAVSAMPEAKQWATHLQAGLRSLSATVNNVLQFHAKAGVQLAPVDLERLLGELKEFLLPVARQRRQDIKFENGIGKVPAQADANRLKQVFLNLAINGFRAMPPGGTLKFRLQWAPQFPGGLAQIEVQDDGRGIPEELREKIFEAGFTTTPGSPGLGLAVCKRIVEQHGGEITVQSRQKEGTKFTIVLPATGAKA